ncbi:tyrosine-protein kinase hopscotch [Asbolus verrucosus]|uniref:Tyrosine-protein kinase hopscotch n=1 Tax=Asbolus verrucosus TaxID=1661398 RepID=A0A482VXW3_ASBVE|nr:tyrosine-protein kinase hopscotch [Asbolus verrucosus]
MSEPHLNINTVLDNKVVPVPYNSATTAEDVCIYVCKQIGILTIARHLFGLRITGKSNFLRPNAQFTEKNNSFDLRIRFKIPNIVKLRKIDEKAYDYYFHQARNDVLENKIPDIIYEKYRRELVGLGITDMYRVMLEKDIPRETVENEYKKYIPKEVLKRHAFFIKKPIHETLGKLQKSVHDAKYVKAEYLKQLDIIAPEYLSEVYKAVTDEDGAVCSIFIKITPYHPTAPGIKYCFESKKDLWHQICTIEELGFISIRDGDGTVEISRKNGIPFYLKFSSNYSMFSFISLLDGYYRLTCKWTFNICKDVPTPSLQRLYAMKCHGPVGGEFSYAKLEEKRGNRPGCFIIRESAVKYNNYYIDVCTKDSCNSKPKTFKLERITGDEFIFNDDVTRYKSIQQLMAAYNDPNGAIFLQECLPPSEYDKSPLLLCQSDNLPGDSLTDSSALSSIMPTAPLCINCKDLQVYKVLFVFFRFTNGNEESDNITDLSACKVSHLGLEYHGDIGKTESWVRCQSWSSNNPHPISNTIVDVMFPEYSKKRARNYCRNPTKDPDGPWCYTMNLDLKYETCGIPLCSVRACKITGPGIEYSGKHRRGISDRKCLKWNKDRNKVKEGSTYTSYDKFKKTKFPEGDVSKAKKYCRNPNGDIGGPWCFVEDEDTDEIEREYCDIPFCHEPDCEVFTKNTQNYTHYTDFNNTLRRFDFGLKLWDSDSYMNASARLVLALLALPLTGQEMKNLGTGVEILISNKASALTFGNVDSKPEHEETHGILKSTEYTMFTLSWESPFITLSLEGKIKPIFLAEYKTKKNLLGYKKNVFNFYSAQGTNVLWSFPFCRDDFECDVHTTTASQFQQFWPLKSNEVGQELQFYLRAFHSVYILFVSSPTSDYPNTKLVLQRSSQMSRVTVSGEADSIVIVKEIELPEILDYWSWREFSISFFADTLQFYWTKSVGTNMIFEIRHNIFRKMRWFSPSSDTVAHWTFFCAPPEVSKPPPAFLPECVLKKDEDNYKGTQDVTNLGMPCLPWSGAKLLPSKVRDNIPLDQTLAMWNYCRDPLEEKKGTYCYTFAADKSIEKNYCRIRKCKSEDCRMAGTGNDYMGSLALTRSNRTCDSWFDNITVHPLEHQFINISLFADISLDDVKNYCRNPSRDMAGPWCYTTDPAVLKDLCNVRDCDRPEENTIIMNRIFERRVYILPQWKITGFEFALKQWDPDYSDAMQFDIFPMHGDDRIRLVIGAKNNDKIELYHNNELKKEKTFPHLIAPGKWTDFWLVMRTGEISLGFKGVPNSFFEYVNEKVFDPAFVNFGSVDGDPIGLFFKNDQCHTENASTDTYTKTMPIGLWSQTEKLIHRNFTLLIRGQGVVIIPMMALLRILHNFVLSMDSFKKEVSIYFDEGFVLNKTLNDDLFVTDKWTSFQISFTESYFNVIRENKTILTYHSTKPLLFYWFSLGVNRGWVVWSVNCEPLDIDGPPRDGGWSRWSPWHCTVSCGGGEGFRTRTCSNPTPNILGKLCPGSHKSTGICNDFACGDVSPNTLEKIRESLQTHQFSFVIDEGRSIILENDRDLLKAITEESPDAYHEWTLNGIFITPEANRIIFDGDDLIIRNAEVTDSGVYVCMLYRINRKRIVLKVITLAVVSEDYNVKTRASRSLVIPCNAVVLAYIYSDLSLKLYLNGEVYKDFGTTMLAAVNSEHFDSLNTSHTGDWKCVVEQKDLKLSWVTNYVRVNVKKAPNFYTNLMEDEMTKPVFGWLQTENNVLYALIFIAVFVVLLVLLFLCLYFKYCTVKSRWQ